MKEGNIVNHIKELMEISDNNCKFDGENVLISELSLSPRLRNILNRAGCVRIRDIEQYSKDAIIRFRIVVCEVSNFLSNRPRLALRNEL